jgi:hypothetical protein
LSNKNTSGHAGHNNIVGGNNHTNEFIPTWIPGLFFAGKLGGFL